jgi:rubrerythrin
VLRSPAISNPVPWEMIMESPDAEIVEVYAAADVTEAHFLRDLLAENGIEARVVGESLQGGLIPTGDLEIAPRLWVFRHDEARATELLKAYERIHTRPHGDEEPANTWKCPTCSETVEEEFELCWNCQTPRKPY